MLNHNPVGPILSGQPNRQSSGSGPLRGDHPEFVSSTRRCAPKTLALLHTGSIAIDRGSRSPSGSDGNMITDMNLNLSSPIQLRGEVDHHKQPIDDFEGLANMTSLMQHHSSKEGETVLCRVAPCRQTGEESPS